MILLSNLIEIYGTLKKPISGKKTEHLPDGVVVSAGQNCRSNSRSFSTVDINEHELFLTYMSLK